MPTTVRDLQGQGYTNQEIEVYERINGGRWVGFDEWGKWREACLEGREARVTNGGDKVSALKAEVESQRKRGDALASARDAAVAESKRCLEGYTKATAALNNTITKHAQDRLDDRRKIEGLTASRDDLLSALTRVAGHLRDKCDATALASAEAAIARAKGCNASIGGVAGLAWDEWSQIMGRANRKPMPSALGSVTTGPIEYCLANGVVLVEKTTYDEVRLANKRASDRVNTLEADARTLNGKLEHWQKLVHQVDGDRCILYTRATAAEQSMNGLRAELAGAERDLSNLRKERSESTNHMAAMRAELDDAIRKSKNACSNYAMLAKDYMTVRDECTRLREALTAEHAKYSTPACPGASIGKVYRY